MVPEPYFIERERFRWVVTVHQGRGSTVYYARHAAWKDGALCMSTAQIEVGPPNDPYDEMIIYPLPDTIITLKYIGAEQKP